MTRERDIPLPPSGHKKTEGSTMDDGLMLMPLRSGVIKPRLATSGQTINTLHVVGMNFNKKGIEPCSKSGKLCTERRNEDGSAGKFNIFGTENIRSRSAEAGGGMGRVRPATPHSRV
jgi:hypothetical protein